MNTVFEVPIFTLENRCFFIPKTGGNRPEKLHFFSFLRNLLNFGCAFNFSQFKQVKGHISFVYLEN